MPNTKHQTPSAAEFQTPNPKTNHGKLATGAPTAPTAPTKPTKLSFTSGLPLASLSVCMDSLVSLLNGDLSIWGVLAMPVGVALCFGPALVAWLRSESKAPAKDDKDSQ